MADIEEGFRPFAVFAPSGLLVATATGGRSAYLYRCDVCRPLDELVELADQRVMRELSPDERARFLHER